MRGRDAMVVAGVAVIAAVMVQAGPLSPPAGPVAASYKTLAEIEPGIPLSSVPAGQGATHLITQPGRYYLTGNMTGVTGQYGVGVTVPDVTIDLCGFTLQGTSGALHGIVDLIGVPRVSVRNGCIKGWSGKSVVTMAGSEWVCRDLRVHAGSDDGIRLGPRGHVEGCTVTGSAETGVDVGPDSRVAGCSVSGCVMTGIYAGDGTRVESCIVAENSMVGLMGGSGVTVSGCEISRTHVYNGSGDAIVLDQDGLVERCVIEGNEGEGVYSNLGGTVIRGNKIGRNKGNGINVKDYCLITENEVHFSGTNSGGSALAAGVLLRGVANRVEANHLVANSTAVKILGTQNLVARNSFSMNGAHVSAPAGNSVAQIIQAPASGFASTDPWVNFNY